MYLIIEWHINEIQYIRQHFNWRSYAQFYRAVSLVLAGTAMRGISLVLLPHNLLYIVSAKQCRTSSDTHVQCSSCAVPLMCSTVCSVCYVQYHKQCHPCAVPIMRSAYHVQCLLYLVPLVCSAYYMQCHPCALPIICSAIHVLCLLCAVPSMCSAVTAPQQPERQMKRLSRKWKCTSQFVLDSATAADVPSHHKQSRLWHTERVS